MLLRSISAHRGMTLMKYHSGRIGEQRRRGDWFHIVWSRTILMLDEQKLFLSVPFLLDSVKDLLLFLICEFLFHSGKQELLFFGEVMGQQTLKRLNINLTIGRGLAYFLLNFRQKCSDLFMILADLVHDGLNIWNVLLQCRKKILFFPIQVIKKFISQCSYQLLVCWIF